MELDFNSTLQAILIIVLIIQTGYLARQTNFFKRSSQSTLTNSWNKELFSIKPNILSLKNLNIFLDEDEFANMIDILHRMHNQFKDKLLKPSDFAIFFVSLYLATINKNLKQTNTYRENYLKLQIIFNDFNKDVDAVMYFYTLPNTSAYEKILDEIRIFKKYKRLKKAAFKNWPLMIRSLKIGIWWKMKVERKQFFKLDLLITDDKSKMET